jgi:DNA-binding MarR family transcriptional regulator
MARQILKDAVSDLLSIPPILNRTFRHKVSIKTFGDIYGKITSLHHEIIILLLEEGPLSMGEICDQLMISKAQMTQLITKLVELNIVERRTVDGDRRKIQIELSETGKRLLMEHWKNLDNSVMNFMSGLTEKDLKALSDALFIVKDILSRLK